MATLEDGRKVKVIGLRKRGRKNGDPNHPGGRPADYPGFRKRCREWMMQGDQGWDILTGMATTEGPQQFLALRYICDHAYGQPKQEVDVSGTIDRRELSVNLQVFTVGELQELLKALPSGDDAA